MTDFVLMSFFPDGSRLLQRNIPAVWEDLFGENVKCPTPYLELSDSYAITHPSVVIAACFSLIVGIYFGFSCLHESRKAKYWESYYMYGMSFFFFAMMNISALFYHGFCPPPLYIHELPPNLNFLELPSVTHVAHVVDICSTCCSCFAFLIGRLYYIKFLNKWHPHVFMYIFASIYVIGFFGLMRNRDDDLLNSDGFPANRPNIPFLGEVLYPGVIALTSIVAPLCNWPRHKLSALALCGLCLGAAFGAALLEKQLCQYCGEYFTYGSLWLLANFSYCGMRAQNNSNGFWRAVSFAFGFPHTLVTYVAVDEGSQKAYGVDVPRVNPAKADTKHAPPRHPQRPHSSSFQPTWVPDKHDKHLF